MTLRALLVGINGYADSPLRGCVNDVERIKTLLTQQYGLQDDQLRLLANADATAEAITSGLAWLAQPDPSDTVRLFYYAGHGTQQADLNGDEPDGADECILPFDYATAGAMTDDVLRQLYAQFTPDTRLLLVMDCCHSGTINKPFGSTTRQRFMPLTPDEFARIEAARLAYEQQHGSRALAADASTTEADPAPAASAPQGEQPVKQRFGQDASNQNIVLLAACRPEQTAADAKFGETFHGALSFYLSALLERSTAPITYGELIEQLQSSIRKNKFDQVPQLECHPAALTQPWLWRSA